MIEHVSVIDELNDNEKIDINISLVFNKYNINKFV